MPDFESLLSRLIDHHVDFVIVGGFAAVAHGSSLLTQDVDICCRLSTGY
jgi:molybdopterin-guanine dinucleotide biosynthesis protein